jgi:hypothetical protein
MHSLISEDRHGWRQNFAVLSAVSCKALLPSRREVVTDLGSTQVAPPSSGRAGVDACIKQAPTAPPRTNSFHVVDP